MEYLREIQAAMPKPEYKRSAALSVAA